MSKTKNIVLAAICAAVLIISSFIMIFSSYSGAEKIVANFVSAVNSKSSENIIKCFTDENQIASQLAYFFDADDILGSEYFELAGFSSNELTVEKVKIVGMYSEQIDDDNQTVTLFVELTGTSENGEKIDVGKTLSYNCVQSSGGWKINAIDLL